MPRGCSLPPTRGPSARWLRSSPPPVAHASRDALRAVRRARGPRHGASSRARPVSRSAPRCPPQRAPARRARPKSAPPPWPPKSRVAPVARPPAPAAYYTCLVLLARHAQRGTHLTRALRCHRRRRACGKLRALQLLPTRPHPGRLGARRCERCLEACTSRRLLSPECRLAHSPTLLGPRLRCRGGLGARSRYLLRPPTRRLPRTAVKLLPELSASCRHRGRRVGTSQIRLLRSSQTLPTQHLYLPPHRVHVGARLRL